MEGKKQMAVTLEAKIREKLTKSATRELRESGQVPAVVYGKGKDTKTIYVKNVDLIKTVREEGRNAVIKLDIEDDSAVDVMLHDYQMDPIRNELLHVDFYMIDLTEAVDVAVAVRLEGEAEGEREGGIVQQPLYELQVRAVPTAIPDEIVVDVTELEIGDVITVGDLPQSDDYEFLDEEDAAVANVLPPEEEEAIEEDPVDLSVEPELVGAEDEDEEETAEDEDN